MAFVSVYNYADDNALVSSGYDYNEAQNNLLKNAGNVMAWFNNNFMQANPNKFKYIVFGNYNNIEDISINDVALKPQSEVKLLGLHLDNKLTFNSHITKLCQKA